MINFNQKKKRKPQNTRRKHGYVCDLGVGKNFIKAVKEITKENIRKMSAVNVAMHKTSQNKPRNTNISTNKTSRDMVGACNSYKNKYRLFELTLQKDSALVEIRFKEN